MKYINICLVLLMSAFGGFLFGLLVVTSASVHGDLVDIGEMVSATIVEQAFASTLRSCLSSKCYDKPMGRSGDLVRVGVLGLPGTGATLVPDFSISSSKIPLSHHIVHDNHVPAYGYGKNHGWSRIIRFARDIFDHAYFLVKNTNSFGTERNFLQAYEAQVHLIKAPLSILIYLLCVSQIRQLARWHCRLSHVAAHTKMLTGVCFLRSLQQYALTGKLCNIKVFTEDLVKRPAFEWDRILSFLGVDVDRVKLLAAAERFTAMLVSETRFSEKVPSAIRERGLQTLNDEMKKTRNLADWPCLSFKPLDKAKLPLTAEMLSPNCSSIFVQCSVPIDIRGG